MYRPGAGATARLRDAIQAGRTDTRLLVPTATLVEHRRHQLAREGLIFRPDLIQTLSRFAASLAPGARLVSEPLLQVLVEEALRELKLPEFAPVTDAPGFPASLTRTIQELDAAAVEPGALAHACRAYPFAQALARVWRNVLESLKTHGLSTRSGVLRDARAAAHGNVFGTLLLEGFANLSTPEADLLDAVRASAEVVVFEPERAQSPVTTTRFVADTDLREAEEIARRILELVRGGVDFREIGVALRNADRHTAVLQPVLERFGIPVRFYFSVPLMENPAARFAAETVEALLSGWDHQVCRAVLRLQPWGGNDRMDFEIREKLPQAGLTTLRELARDDRTRTLIDGWMSLEPLRTRRSKAARWAAELGESLRKLYRVGQVEDGLPWSSVERARSQAAALNTFDSALVEAAERWSGMDQPVTLPEFWAVARTVLRHTALRVPDARRNVVHVMSVFEARQWDLHTIFVCGLAEKEFPRRHPQDAFLPDAAMEQLARAGFRVRTSAGRDAEEEELFRFVKQSAGQQLVLSYAREGKDAPSKFWAECDIAEEECPAVRPALALTPDRNRPASIISNAALLQWIAERHDPFRVTALEKYLACPFQFFAGGTLDLKTAPPRPEDRLDNLQQGILVHKVLAEWLPEHPPIGPLFERIFEAFCAKLRVTTSYRTELARGQMLRNLQLFEKASERWPRGHQAKAEQELKFAIAQGVQISGRVDRMETLPDGRLVVIDYKYSNEANTEKKARSEASLQGPLYTAGLEGEGRAVAAMVYYSLKNGVAAHGHGEIPGLKADLEPLTPDWVAQGVGEALRAVAELRAGRIIPQPVSDEPCRYCVAKDACRYVGEAAMTAGGS
ncbi:MAG: PD-(D/E)XK nuclease family protein [Acidobacteriota bacterium]|nr:PD-(D/E)XK nuclease family protein [Acidobacteriota bacterium]